MSPSKVALSLVVVTNTKDGGEFSREGPSKDRPEIHLREGQFRPGAAGRLKVLPMAAIACEQIYRDSLQRNLRNRRMTSFIDHVATINLI